MLSHLQKFSLPTIATVLQPASQRKTFVFTLSGDSRWPPKGEAEDFRPGTPQRRIAKREERGENVLFLLTDIGFVAPRENLLKKKHRQFFDYGNN
jgi:hypothetical protein